MTKCEGDVRSSLVIMYFRNKCSILIVSIMYNAKFSKGTICNLQHSLVARSKTTLKSRYPATVPFLNWWCLASNVTMAPGYLCAECIMWPLGKALI